MKRRVDYSDPLIHWADPCRKELENGRVVQVKGLPLPKWRLKQLEYLVPYSRHYRPRVMRKSKR